MFSRCLSFKNEVNTENIIRIPEKEDFLNESLHGGIRKRDFIKQEVNEKCFFLDFLNIFCIDFSNIFCCKKNKHVTFYHEI